MKKVSSLLSVSLAFALLTSCGGKKYDPNTDPVTAMYDSMAKADSLRQWGPPKAITFDQARDTGDLDGSRVTIEGYISVSSTIFESDHHTSLQLWERKGQGQGDYVSVGIDIGKGNNEMSPLPTDYKKSDLTLKDDKGNEVHYGDRIRVTGIFSKSYSDGYGSVSIQSFEKIDDVEIDYSSLGADKITIDTTGHAAHEGKLVMAEGYLEVPMYVSVGQTAHLNLLPTQNADDYLYTDIMVGNGPDMVENIPDDFSESDIKVHDHKNQIVGKKKVRVYGVWQYDRIAVERIETL